MNNKEILDMIEAHAKSFHYKEETGHDWWHINRVRNLALQIAKKEQADLFIIELASLLHDLGDYKIHGEDLGSKPAKEILEKLNVNPYIILHVCEIIENLSFSKGKTPSTKEGRIVQDADRLDALGAIGIARCFATGVKFKRPIYDPEDKKNSIQHFYDKLLTLKNNMHTQIAKEIAQERHKFIQQFLDQFLEEWG